MDNKQLDKELKSNVMFVSGHDPRNKSSVAEEQFVNSMLISIKNIRIKKESL